jgi:ATP-binding cassette subfamily F protein 3
VLDEPTNHLDIEACEVLEDALRGYTGTLVFISHDRDFIDALATRVVEVDGGRLREFLGNYGDYLERVRGGAGGAPGTGPTPAEREGPAPGPAEGGEASPSAPRRPRGGREAHARARERQRARERAERRVERLEAEILERESAASELGWRLGDPAVFRDADAVRDLESRRDALRREIDALYREWERTAAELEALDAAPDAPGSVDAAAGRP